MSSLPETLDLSSYSPMWPAVFDMERVRLDQIFGPGTVAIEHIGSTAVPGLGAKPIIATCQCRRHLPTRRPQFPPSEFS